MTASLTHKTSQTPQCYDLQMPCGSRCLIIFTCRCLISAYQKWACCKMRWLSVGCHSDALALGTGPFHRSPPWWISYISKARGNPEKHIVGSAHASAIQPPPHKHPPGRQWVGNTATVYGAERSFLLVSSSFLVIGTCSTSARERLCLCMNMT